MVAAPLPRSDGGDHDGDGDAAYCEGKAVVISGYQPINL